MQPYEIVLSSFERENETILCHTGRNQATTMSGCCCCLSRLLGVSVWCCKVRRCSQLGILYALFLCTFCALYIREKYLMSSCRSDLFLGYIRNAFVVSQHRHACTIASFVGVHVRWFTMDYIQYTVHRYV